MTATRPGVYELLKIRTTARRMGLQVELAHVGGLGVYALRLIRRTDSDLLMYDVDPVRLVKRAWTWIKREWGG